MPAGTVMATRDRGRILGDGFGRNLPSVRKQADGTADHARALPSYFPLCDARS